MVARTTRSRRLLAGAVVVLLGAGLLCPLSADAFSSAKWRRRAAKRGTCSPPQSLARLDKKTFPETRFRPPIVVSRACCENRNGRTHCKPFPTCPPRSPS